MQSENQVEGIWTALWTPTDEKGALLKDAIEQHLDFLLNAHVTGIAVAGSTGQFPYLDVATRKELLQIVCQKVGSERVFVNISDMHPANVKELAAHAKELKVRAIMLLPPMYYPFDQFDLVTYFVTMAKIADRPLVLYNYPECVRNRIELETLDNVSGDVPVLGIKQSGSDFSYHVPLIDVGKKSGFKVFTGADPRFAEALKLGVAGSIGGLSNAVPELMVQIYQAFKANDEKKIQEASAKVSKIERLLARVAFPLNISALMKAKGLVVGAHKEILSATTIEEYDELVLALGDIFKEYSV